MESGFDWVRWVVAALTVLAAGAWFYFTELDNVKRQTGGYSFADTLPKTIEADGGDARVVSVLIRDKDVSFSVLTGDGRVSQRYYGSVCTSSAKGPNCSYRSTHKSHRASARERRAALVRLDQLDPGAVDRLRKEADIPKSEPLGLRGRRWVVGSFEPSVAATADLDGSHVRRAESRADRALARSVAEDPGSR